MPTLSTPKDTLLSKLYPSKVRKITSTQQSAIISEGQSLKLKKVDSILTNHKDVILCLFFVDMNHVATGSKDKTIKIYNFDRERVATLIGHNAPICTLSLVKDYSGK